MSLTLSPALCALLLKPHGEQHSELLVEQPIRGFFRLLQPRLRLRWRAAMAGLPARVVRFAVLMLVVYVGIIWPSASTNSARRRSGFIPQVDRGYLIIVVAIAAGRVAGAHRRGEPARRRDCACRRRASRAP